MKKETTNTIRAQFEDAKKNDTNNDYKYFVL